MTMKSFIYGYNTQKMENGFINSTMPNCDVTNNNSYPISNTKKNVVSKFSNPISFDNHIFNQFVDKTESHKIQNTNNSGKTIFYNPYFSQQNFYEKR